MQRKRVRIRDRDYSDPHNADVIDFKSANRFLNVLDPDATFWTFQTFDENKKRDDKTLARIIHGSLCECFDELSRLNSLGAGVFVTVNETNGKGRKIENIKRIRALVLDLDGSPVEPVYGCKLQPHLVVETSQGRFHALWRVCGLRLTDFKSHQHSVAERFDGDPAVAQPTLVVRVPGFFHNKGEPFASKINTASQHAAYSAEAIASEFPPIKKPHKQPKSLLVLSPTSPRKSAAAFVEHLYLPPGCETPILGLAYYRGDYYRFTGTHYEQLDADIIRKQIYAFLDSAYKEQKGDYVPFDPDSNHVRKVEDALRHAVLLDKAPQQPFWILPEGKVHEDGNIIVCQNGLFDVRRRKLMQHDPAFFSVVALPFEYDPDAPTPVRWHRFLREVWPDDKEARRTLQEIFGLLLTSDTRYQKMFGLFGPIRSGKGTIGRVITELLGKDNVAYPTFGSLAGEFGGMQLINKSCAIISDARGKKDGSSVVLERLLSITGEDPQSINRKNKEFWSGNITARFIMMSNELPRINDAAGALASRFILLMMKHSFYGREDKDLTDRLKEELPAIFNWSIVGLDRLRERGHFEQPTSAKDAIRVLEDAASPVKAFIRDCCFVEPDARVPVKRLFAAWTAWCEAEGHVRGSSNSLGRSLRAVVANIACRGRNPGKFYEGIGLNED